MADNNPSDKPGLESITSTFIYNMYEQADKLNPAFVQGRLRMDEMADAVTRTAAGVIRLGGSIGNVSETIAKIAEGSRRNVIATEEQVSKLYAASELLNKSSDTIVENFGAVGVDAALIGEKLEDSFSYVQSIGLNAKVVMGTVVDNMELMNRFNFSNGVEGLTKMAAQASMLRFDMNKTADFADNVMSPEKAIEAAAGFQRLGVNVGNLIDPMALLNDSINDPGALQDSLIKMTEQFTEFDAETKTFKINPSAILVMKELADVTGISAKDMAKTAIAAADLNRRVSMINPSLQFDKPEDKELLANMATMEGGEYVVQLKNDKTGEVDRVKLSEITNEELRALRKQQDEKPKTLEEIQISQLEYLKNIYASMDAMVAKGTYGLAGAAKIRGNVLGAERVVRSLGDTAYERVPSSARITETINNQFKKMSDLYEDKKAGRISETELTTKLAEIQANIKTTALDYGKRSGEEMKQMLLQSAEKISGNSDVERAYKRYVLGNLEGEGSNEKRINSKVDFSGLINFKVDAPAGITEQQFKSYFETEDFKNMIYRYYEEKLKEFEQK
jgi:hypothetical protein